MWSNACHQMITLKKGWAREREKRKGSLCWLAGVNAESVVNRSVCQPREASHLSSLIRTQRDKPGHANLTLEGLSFSKNDKDWQKGSRFDTIIYQRKAYGKVSSTCLVQCGSHNGPVMLIGTRLEYNKQMRDKWYPSLAISRCLLGFLKEW